MILDNQIRIKINSTSLKHYRNRGYDVNKNDIITVKIEDLSPFSTYKINVKCDVCGNEKILRYSSYLKNVKNTGIYCCSNKCAYSIKNKKTCLERYGIGDYNNKEKCKKTCLEKYGVENVFQCDEVKTKIKETNLEKYGDVSHNRSEIVKINKKETFLKKYGVSCYLNSEVQKEKSKIKKLEKFGNLNNHGKLKNTFLEKYNTDHPSKVKEFKDKRIKNYKKTIINKILLKYDNIGMIKADFDNDKFTFNCEKGHQFEINRNLLKNRIKYHTLLCTICNPISSHISGQEILFNNYIEEIYKKEILLNNKNIINPMELDIYLPELKLAFEFNGVYWHNELHRENNYHFNKTEFAEKHGIKLIHIYEDDWIYKQNIIKSRIRNLLGKSEKIYARKCNIKEVFDNKLIKDFLDKNHLQGNINSKIKIGLFHQDELVSLMTFGNLRRSMGQKTIYGFYELLRFCNKLNTTVIGGSSKLFKYFLDKYNPLEVISYADRSWSQGDLYEKLGFNKIHKTPPNYYYVVNGIRKHRFQFRKNILVKEGSDPCKSEHEIMLDKGIFRIYDSGHLKYSWKNNLIYNN